MAYAPIAFIAPNYRDYKNWWLKAYEPGTTTPKSMASDYNGSIEVSKYELNKDGFPVSSGDAIVIPFVDGDYDLWLFRTEEEADNNDTTEALRLADNNQGSLLYDDVGDIVGDYSDYQFDTISDAKDGTVISGETINYKAGQVVRVKETRSLYDVIAGSSNGNDRTVIVENSGSFSLVQRPPFETYTDYVWYVDPIQGTDAIGFGVTANTGAFKTIQYAYDQLPVDIRHQQTIQLADGTYNTNYLPPGQSVALPRPAILFGRGKFIAARTQKTGNDLEGAIVIKGNQVTPGNVIIEPGDTYTYGVYNGQGQLAIQDLIVRTNPASTDVTALLVSHRMDSRIHTVNVSLDGFDKAVTGRGILTESGGSIEFTSNAPEIYIKNCDILTLALTAGDRVTISGNYTLSDANIGLQTNAPNEIKVDSVGVSGATISNCSVQGLFAQYGGKIGIRGAAINDRVLITSIIEAQSGGIIEFVWVDSDTPIDITESTLKLDDSDYQQRILLQGGDLTLGGSNSYISPNTNNSDVNPIVLLYGSRIYKEGVNNIVGSGGAVETYNVVSLGYTADDEVLPTLERSNTYTVTGSGSPRSNCEIDSTGVAEGRTIDVEGETWSVEFNNAGTHMSFSAKISIGNVSGNYTGARFMMRDGLWRLVSLGQLIP